MMTAKKLLCASMWDAEGFDNARISPTQRRILMLAVELGGTVTIHDIGIMENKDGGALTHHRTCVKGLVTKGFLMQSKGMVRGKPGYVYTLPKYLRSGI